MCCSADQVETLSANLQQAEALISSCPACRNNFRDFFCAFTCSPDQGSFVNVSSTQTTKEGKTAVSTVEFYVGEELGTGFFDSCKEIKFGATNGYAMDLLGGGNAGVVVSPILTLLKLLPRWQEQPTTRTSSSS